MIRCFSWRVLPLLCSVLLLPAATSETEQPAVNEGVLRSISADQDFDKYRHFTEVLLENDASVGLKEEGRSALEYLSHFVHAKLHSLGGPDHAWADNRGLVAKAVHSALLVDQVLQLSPEENRSERALVRDALLALFEAEVIRLEDGKDISPEEAFRAKLAENEIDTRGFGYNDMCLALALRISVPTLVPSVWADDQGDDQLVTSLAAAIFNLETSMLLQSASAVLSDAEAFDEQKVLAYIKTIDDKVFLRCTGVDKSTGVNLETVTSLVQFYVEMSINRRGGEKMPLVLKRSFSDHD